MYLMIMTIDDADDAHGHDQGVTKQELHPSPGPPTVPSHKTPACQDEDKLLQTASIKSDEIGKRHCYLG